MLHLNTNKFYNILGYGQQRKARITNFYNNNYNNGYRGIYTDTLGFIQIPFVLNEKNLITEFFEAATNMTEEQCTNIKDNLFTRLNTQTDNEYRIIEAYLLDPDNQWFQEDYQLDFVDSDVWSELKDGPITSLYNKCDAQISAREYERTGIEFEKHTRVFKSRIKHAILVVSDNPDTVQESTLFLTYGLMPVLFPDYKDILCEEEIDFFKSLVNRSQVKRISNVKVNDAFNKIIALKKYIEKEAIIKRQVLVRSLVKRRTQELQNKLMDKERRIDDLLRAYDEDLRQLEQIKIILDNTRDSENELIEEIQQAVTTEGVVDVDTNNNNSINITFKTPVKFYDTEEAEMQLARRPDSVWKRVINSLFVEEKGKMYVLGMATFSFVESFRPMGYIQTHLLNMHQALFNPHLHYYSCMGDYRPAMTKAMRDSDITMFINIGLATTKSINFKDGAVIGRWIEEMNNTWLHDNSNVMFDLRCIESDNQMFTVREWIENNNFDEEPELEVTEL